MRHVLKRSSSSEGLKAIGHTQHPEDGLLQCFTTWKVSGFPVTAGALRECVCVTGSSALFCLLSQQHVSPLRRAAAAQKTHRPRIKSVDLYPAPVLNFSTCGANYLFLLMARSGTNDADQIQTCIHKPLHHSSDT